MSQIEEPTLVSDGKEDFEKPRFKLLPKADYLIQDVQLSCSEWSSMTGDKTNLVSTPVISSNELDDHHLLKYATVEPLNTLRESMKIERNRSLESIVRILTSSLSALQTLHQNKIRHGSFGPDSILLSFDPLRVNPLRVQLDDGIEYFCRLSHNNRKSETPLMKWNLFSPEEFFVSKPRSFATDMYAFGCLMYFLLTDGEDPWSEESVFTVQNKVVIHKMNPLVSKTLSLVPMPETLFRLMVQCLSYEPEHRPSATQALSVLSSLPLTVLSLDLDYISDQVEKYKLRATALEDSQRAEYYTKMQSLNADGSWFSHFKQCFYSALFSCCR
jgi:serine/threonine protein kinase